MYKLLYTAVRRQNVVAAYFSSEQSLSTLFYFSIIDEKLYQAALSPHSGDFDVSCHNVPSLHMGNVDILSCYFFLSEILV